uniref:Uncharacterized protein n=1 Tax=Triticum urartu TaxID=4572 RepID=A0A8R7QZ75_TRIUA
MLKNIENIIKHLKHFTCENLRIPLEKHLVSYCVS